MDYAGMVDSGGWVQDFTYLWFERSMHYLAVVLDLKNQTNCRLAAWAAPQQRANTRGSARCPEQTSGTDHTA